jgi:uncharacterized protein
MCHNLVERRAPEETTRDNGMTIEELLRTKRDEILRIAERHGAHEVRVFGSVIRGEATEASDIDFLVSTRDRTSPWFPAGLVEDLEALLGRKVDVVTEAALYWLLRRRILKQARPL